MAEKFPVVFPIQGPGYALGGENRLQGPVNQHIVTDPGLDQDLRGVYSPGSPGLANFGPPIDGFGGVWLYNVLTSMTIYYEDDGTFNADGFGAGPALTNGIRMRIVDDQEVEKFGFMGLTNSRIQTNGEWLEFFGGGAVRVANYGAGTNQYLSVRIDFAQLYGLNFVLNPGWKLEIDMQDDLTGLVDLSAVVHGRIMVAPKGGGVFLPL